MFLLDKALIYSLNLLFNANPEAQAKLSKLAGNVICLQLPLLALNLAIEETGQISKSSAEANCSIIIPLAASSYFIHQEEIKTFQQIKIIGNAGVAREFLALFKNIKYSNILYQHNSPLAGVIALQAEKLLIRLIDYLKLVSNNASTSTSQYLQYEINFITDKYLLLEFYSQVDELTERYDLLTKRVERLLQK